MWWNDLIGRVDGPLAFRFVPQPIVALLLGIRAGVRDARAGRPPFLLSLVTDPSQRRYLASQGWKDVGHLFLVAWTVDIAYQLFILKRFEPGQGLIVSTLLAFVPYTLVRGIANRTARMTAHRRQEQ